MWTYPLQQDPSLVDNATPFFRCLFDGVLQNLELEEHFASLQAESSPQATVRRASSPGSSVGVELRNEHHFHDCEAIWGGEAFGRHVVKRNKDLSAS